MSKVTFPKQKSALLPWADGVSLKPAPGGGILRISYDEERFLLACKEVILEPQPEEKEQLIIENGEAEKKVVKKVEIKNEEVLVLMKELDLTKKVAEELLKSTEGDLLKALVQFTTPSV